MFKRFSLGMLAAGLLVSLAADVSAQGRLFGPQLLDLGPFRSNTRGKNPLYEEMKIQAEKAYDAGEFARAIELCSSVLSKDEKDDVAYYLRASARVEQGRYEDNVELIRSGISDAREAIRYSEAKNVNYYLPYLYGMTSLSGLEKRPEHAEASITVANQVMEKATLKPSEKANFLYQRGLAQMHRQKYKEAAADFAEAVSLAPTHKGALLMLPDAYTEAGDIDQALKAYSQSVMAFPSDPLVYNNRGMFYQQEDRPDEAIADFTRAVQLDEYYFVAYTNRGFTLMEQGKLLAAESDFSQSLRIEANQPLVHSLRGTCRLRAGRLDGAITDYLTVLQSDSKNPTAHADLGFAYYFAGRYDDAAASFQQAMTLEESFLFLAPWQYLALTRAGHEREAKQQFGRLARLPNRKQEWSDTLAGYLQGRERESTLFKTISQSPKEEQPGQQCEAHFFIAERLQQAGKVDEANEHYRKALETTATELSAYRGAQYALKEFPTED